MDQDRENDKEGEIHSGRTIRVEGPGMYIPCVRGYLYGLCLVAGPLQIGHNEDIDSETVKGQGKRVAVPCVRGYLYGLCLVAGPFQILDKLATLRHAVQQRGRLQQLFPLPTLLIANGLRQRGRRSGFGFATPTTTTTTTTAAATAAAAATVI